MPLIHLSATEIKQAFTRSYTGGVSTVGMQLEGSSGSPHALICAVFSIIWLSGASSLFCLKK